MDIAGKMNYTSLRSLLHFKRSEADSIEETPLVWRDRVGRPRGGFIVLLVLIIESNEKNLNPKNEIKAIVTSIIIRYYSSSCCYFI